MDGFTISIVFRVISPKENYCPMCMENRIKDVLDNKAAYVKVKRGKGNIVIHIADSYKERKCKRKISKICQLLKRVFKNIEILEAEAIPFYDKIPEKLYLYRDWNEYTKEIFKYNELYLSSPIDFNDPFDCRIKVYDEDKEINELVSNAKIRCFSEKYDDILMWSHYAASHSGICIEFDAKKIKKKEIIGDFLQVRYVDKMPHYVTDKQINLKRSVSCKYINWEYEKEYRLLVRNWEKNTYHFPKEAITKVYIGCRADNERVLEICDMLESSIKIFVMKKREKEFSLKEEAVEEWLEKWEEQKKC